jgi:hypothetical protein
MADTEKDQKGKSCPCGCDGCGCTYGGYGWRHFGGGFWVLRILIALVIAGMIFCAGVFIGMHVETFRSRSWMMPYGYGGAYPSMMGGYGTRGAIPPVPVNGAAGASGAATAPAASSTAR